MQQAETTMYSAIEDFFYKYSSAVTYGDVDAIEKSYDSYYVEARPTVSAAHETGEDFKKSLQENNKAINGELGFQQANIEIEEIYDVAPNHFIVRTAWTMRFAPQNKKAVDAEFEQTYIMRCTDSDMKILFYVSHRDEMELMKELNLIPSGGD